MTSKQSGPAVRANSKFQRAKPSKSPRGANVVRRPRTKAVSNPILDGLRDKQRCRVFWHGAQCPETHATGSAFCATHTRWVAEGRLKPDLCPVFDSATGVQCERPARGEPGSGNGLCAAHYQSTRRETMPGTERQQAPRGEGKGGNVSYRWVRGVKDIFDATAKAQGRFATDIHKAHSYLWLIEQGKLQEILEVQGCLEDMLQCGLRKKLVELGVELEAG